MATALNFTRDAVEAIVRQVVTQRLAALSVGASEPTLAVHASARHMHL